MEQILLQSNDTLSVKSSANVYDIYNRSGINGLLNFELELVRKRYPVDTFSLVKAWNLATTCARAGKKEEAVYWLERLYDASHDDLYFRGFLPGINNSGEFANIRSEPGFQAIVKKMGLSEYQTPR